MWLLAGVGVIAYVRVASMLIDVNDDSDAVFLTGRVLVVFMRRRDTFSSLNPTNHDTDN